MKTIYCKNCTQKFEGEITACPYCGFENSSLELELLIESVEFSEKKIDNIGVFPLQFLLWWLLILVGFIFGWCLCSLFVGGN